jgi:hypothetical protein
LRHAQLKDFSCTSLCLPYCFMFRDDNSVWLDGVLCSEKTRAHHSHFLVGCPFGPRNGRSRARDSQHDRAWINFVTFHLIRCSADFLTLAIAANQRSVCTPFSARPRNL